jgi:hypothetical protein
MPLQFDNWDPSEHRDEVDAMKTELYGALQLFGTYEGVVIPKLATDNIDQSFKIALHLGDDLRTRIGILLLTQNQSIPSDWGFGASLTTIEKCNSVDLDLVPKIIDLLSDVSKETIVRIIQSRAGYVCEDFLEEHPERTEEVERHLP